MAIRIQLFDGSLLEFPDNTSQDVIDRVAKQETLVRQPAPQARPVVEPPKQEGLGAAFGKGLESLLSSGRTAIGAFTGSPEEAALAALEREKKSPYADQVSLEKVSEAAKRGLLPAAGEVARQVPLAIAEQAPNVLATLGSARLGAMAGAGLGSVVPGIGTAIGGIGGGILGAIAPSLLQQFGGNIQRQAQEQQAQGKPIDISRTAAGLAAVPQAGLDVAASLIPLGRTFAGKVLGPQVEELLKRGSVEGAERLARESLPTVLGKGAAISIATEVPTEVIQTMLERSQAGLALTTPDALAEYGNVAYQAGLLAPIGAVGRVGERAAARSETLLPGQRRGESDMDFANRLSQEIGNDRAYVAAQQTEQAEAAKRQAALEKMKQAIGDGLLTPEVIKQWGFGKGSIFDSLVNKNLSNPEDASFVADVLAAYRPKAHPNTQVKIDDALAGIEAMFGAKPTPQTEGEADVGAAITEPSGAGVQVAGEPDTGAATPRLGAPEPAGVVPPVEDVGQPAGGAEAAPAAVAPPLALPAPPVPPAPPKEGALQGSQTRLILPDGEKRPANWEVIEADSVSASLVEGQAQPRDRQRAASNAQVKSIANNPDFDRLSDTSQTMDYGAPTLTSDYVIVGGNGRFEGINLAYNTEAGQAYKQNLINNAERLGLDPAQVSGMKKPVLIRKLPADSAKPEETRKLAIQSNITAGLEMSDMERAALDSERMTNLNELDITDTGDIPLTTKNMGTVRDALKGYTKEELSGMLAADGSLSQSGLRRVKNAVLYKAYGKTDTLSRLLESPDADLKNVGTALMRASGNMSRLMEGIKSGAIPSDYDIIADLTGSVETLSALRASGTKVQDFINQAEMFEGGLSNEAKTILTFLDQNLRSAKSITEFLNDYANAAISAESAGDGLFGEVELPSKQETIERAAQRPEAERAAAKAQQTIFEQPAGAAVEEGAAKPEGEGRPAEGGEGEVAKPSLAAEAKPLPITPEIQEKIDQLEKVLKKIMNKYGLKDVALKLIDDMKAEGEYAQSVVRLALDAVNPVQALRHESIHALKELGFFTPQQWAVLEKQAKSKWIDQYLKTKNINKEELEEGQKSRYDAYMELYQGDMDAIIEEAIADAFGDFDVNKAPPGLMQAILTRLRNFFDAIKTAFGGEVTAEQVFRKVEKGALKAEAKAEAVPAKPSIRAQDKRGSWYSDATPQQQETLDRWEDERVTGKVSNWQNLDIRPAREDIYDSASAFFYDYEKANGLFDVPITDIGPLSGYDNAKDKARIQNLAEQIKESGEIEPVFVAVDPNGEAYLMEGQHRSRALELLGYKSVPARVIVSMDQEEQAAAKPSLRELKPELKVLGITENALQQFLKYKAADERVGSDPLYAKPADKAAKTRAYRSFMDEMGGFDSAKARKAMYALSMSYDMRGEKSLFAPEEDLFGPAAKPSLRAPQTEAFKRWFGDSKVVDADGKPLVFYHGTGADITAFDESKIATATDGGLYGKGFYFAKNPALAESYALQSSTYSGGAPNIIPVFLSIKNPFYAGGGSDALSVIYKIAGKRPENISGKEGVAWAEKLRKGLIELGYDGVFETDPNSSASYANEVVAFYPTQIKSATGNIGTFDATSPDIRYSLRDKLGMYSELETKIEAGSNKAPAASWKAYINGLTQKGVKPEEIEWSGVRDWLDLQKGTVTKEELLNYLKQGGVKVEEVVLSKSTPQEDETDFDTGRYEEFDGTKYGKYTLPGGENYREVLLTLPDKSADRLHQLDIKLAGGNATLEERKEYYALLDSNLGKGAYRSSHWEPTNVLAHIRVNDRTDADGNKVLFVEEIQSDWGQQLKKEKAGQGGSGTLDEFFARLREEAKTYYLDAADTPEERATATLLGEKLSRRESIDSIAKVLRKETELAEARATLPRGSAMAPAAPFVTKTEGWLNLALKRIMVMAAEGGYDKVAFVNGEQSADRYDLSKQVESISYRDNGNGTYKIVAAAVGRGIAIPEQTVERNNLPDVVGKEIADKIISGEGKSFPKGSVSEGMKELTGLDLKVGGEGMKTFYNTIVPTALKKLLPKVGGGQMMDVNLLKDSMKKYDRFLMKDDLRILGEEGFRAKYAHNEQPGFDVTDAMREKVQTTGLPRFSLRVNIPPSARARVVATTVTRQEKGFVERLMEAISPSSYSDFRAQALNRYNQLGVYDKIRAKKMGGAALLADSSAESAALLSDLGAGLTASALGVHDRMGGIPVYKNGITIISNQNGTIKGPTAIFAPLAGDPSHYQAYQYWAGVKRGSRFLADGREHLFNDPNDKVEAEKIRKAFLKEGIDFETIQKEWIKYNDGLVQYMVDTGVLSADRADSFRKHGDYLPFYRQMTGQETVGPKVFQAISGVKPPKKLKGGEAMLDDFLEAIVRNTQAAIQAGVKNVAAQRAAKVAMDINMARPLGYKSSAPNTFDVLENGKAVTYIAQDQLFINAIKSLGIPDLPFIGLLSGPANLLRNLVTKDPGFMLANLMRDSMSAWVTSGVKMKPVVDTITNFGSAIAGKDPAFQALMNAGILGGYEFSQNVEQSGREFGAALRKQAKIKSTGIKGAVEMGTKPFTSLWDALEKGTTASDAATRMEVYKRTLAETGNEAEALFKALEVMNFNRKGSSAVVRILTAAVPFLNARMQGLDVLYRAASGQMNAADAAQIQKQFFVRGAMIASLSGAYWLLTHDDEEYKKQEQETRDNYWLLPSLGIKIPIPFEIGVLFKVIPERILGYTFGSDTGEDFLKSMARQLTSTLAFNPIPQAVMPVVETMTNFSFFTMRPIVGQGLEGLQPAYQVGPGTSRLAEGLGEMTKGMAKELQVSPAKIDQLISGYTGTMGMYLMNLMDAVYDMNTDSPKPARRFEQMPLIRRFAVDPEARGNVTAYYELKNSVDSIVRTSNMLERTMNYEELPGYMMDNMKMLASKDYILDLEKTMKEFREMKIMIRSASMDASAKKDAILSIDQMENQLTANIQYMKKLAKGD